MKMVSRGTRNLSAKRSSQHPLTPDKIAGSLIKGFAAQKLLRVSIGVMWIVSGLLQAQPAMFTSDFYAKYPSRIMQSLLQQVASGQPSWLHHLLLAGMAIWGRNPIIWNSLVVLLQLALGISVVSRRPRRWWTPVLVSSLLWALFIWVFGEAFGNLFHFQAWNVVSGSPGTTFWLAFASVLLLALEGKSSIAWVSSFLRFFLSAVLLLLGIVQLIVPINWTSASVMASYANAAALPQPSFLSLPIQALVLAVANVPHIGNLFIGLPLVVVGGLLFAIGWRKSILLIAWLWLFWSWWFGQDFGTVFSGLGTDVNSAPLLMMFTIAHRMMARHVGHGTLTSSS